MGLTSFFSREADSTSDQEVNPTRELTKGIYSLPELIVQGDQEGAIERGVYILPVEFFKPMTTAQRINEGMFGYFLTDGKLSRVPIGLCIPSGALGEKTHFEFYGETQITRVTPIQGITYLRMVQTDVHYGFSVGKGKDKCTKLGGPFPVCGLSDTGHPYPVLFTELKNNGVRCTGIYQFDERTLKVFNWGSMQDYADDIYEFALSVQQAKNPVKVFLAKSNLEKKVREVIGENEDNPSGTDESPKSKQASLKKDIPQIDWKEPKTIVRFLDDYVIGQYQAKKTLAVALSKYKIRQELDNELIKKPNTLLIGPPGVGKTFMATLLAKEADFPFAQAKLVGKSSEGYKGENLSTVFDQIRALTDEKEPYAIVFLDEIDKLARDGLHGGHGFGLSLQYELVGWFEEAILFGEDSSKRILKEKKSLNTKNILFITAGAFQGIGALSLADIIQNRLGNGKSKLGFGSDITRRKDFDPDILAQTTPEDLIEYGLLPELVRRISCFAALKPLNTTDLAEILTEAKESPLKQYHLLLEARDFELIIDDGVPNVIATACPTETGASALDEVCSRLFDDILYSPNTFATDKVIHVTSKLAQELLTA